MTSRIAYSLAALSLICLAAPAQAAECGALQRMVSLDMTPVPGGARMLVPVTINGTARKMLLDTAGGLTSLNTGAAQSLGLHASDSGVIRLLDSQGNASTSLVHIDSLQMGRLRSGGVNFMITPDRHAGVDPAYDGVLAADLLSRYDVEMDFAAGKLNYFSPDHCAGHVVYWPATAVGVVPALLRGRADNQARQGSIMQSTLANGSNTGHVMGEGYMPSEDTALFMNPKIAGGDIQVHVLLDGKDFTANIDTGLEHSTLNSDAAKAVFDVTAESPGSAPAASLSQNTAVPAGETVNVFGARIFEHTFHTLSFGGVTVTSPHLLVRPELTGVRDPGNVAVLGTHVAMLDDKVMPDISIGMDVLKHLHLYFAFKEGRLYVTAAAPKSSS